MMKSLVLFIIASLFMYLAFFSWHIIDGVEWGWAKVPTVILCGVLAIFHACLFVNDALGVSNEKG